MSSSTGASAHRFFFALKPDAQTAHSTYAFAEAAFGPKGLLPPAQHHLTLGLTEDFPDVPDEVRSRLMRAGASVTAAGFGLRLDRLVGGRGTLALRPSRVNPQLQDLQQRVALAMEAVDVPMRPGWIFSPHETLAYRSGDPFSRPVAGFDWTVAEFVLVQSRVGMREHRTIGRWPLHLPEPAQGQLL